MDRAHAEGLSPAQFLVDLVERHGDVVRYRSPYNNVYFFNHPRGGEVIAQSNQFQRERLMTLILGYGLLSSDGDYWRGQRRLMAPLFHERCMVGFAPLIPIDAGGVPPLGRAAKERAHARRGVRDAAADARRGGARFFRGGAGRSVAR